MRAIFASADGTGSVRIEQFQARAAVVRAAAAERDEEPARARIEQRADRLAHAEHAARGDDGYGHAVRIGDADDFRRLQNCAAVGEHRVERAFAAIGHRTNADLGVGTRASDAFGGQRASP